VTDTQLVAALQAENARLIALLDAHGIDWQPPADPALIPLVRIESSSALTTDSKLALFRSLFKGRTDIYPLRWESKSGKSGYAPACANEWRPGWSAWLDGLGGLGLLSRAEPAPTGVRG
jgi:hypothetical protein